MDGHVGAGVTPLGKSFPFLTSGPLPVKWGHYSRSENHEHKWPTSRVITFHHQDTHFLDEHTEAGSEQLHKGQAEL